jgi:hypothetical protein
VGTHLKLTRIVIIFYYYAMNYTTTPGVNRKSLFPSESALLASIILSVSCLKLWLVAEQRLTAVPGNIYDDGLFLSNAIFFERGEWLGPYNFATLFKGPMFSVWLAFVHKSGIPLLLAQQLLYLGACLLCIAALRPIFRYTWMPAVFFTVLALNPGTWAAGVGNQIMREGFYTILTLSVVSLAAGLSLRITAKGAWSIIWAIGLGLALASFWLTREEGIWILPLLFLLGVFSLLRISSLSSGRLAACAVFMVPLVFFGLTLAGVAFKNKITYGVFVVTEVTSSPFVDAYRSLMRVRQDEWRPTVLVSRDALRQVYGISPAAEKLHTSMESVVAVRWGTQMKAFREVAKLDPVYAKKLDEWLSSDTSGTWRQAILQENEIHGWFIWALREAAAAAGFHSSGKTASDFYRRLAHEVNEACDSGKLRCEPPGFYLMPRWRPEFNLPFLHSAVRNAIFLARFEMMSAESWPSNGSEEGLALVREMTGERLAPSKFDVRGSVIGPPGSSITISLRNIMGSELASSEIRLGDSDGYGRFVLSGPMTAAAGVYNDSCILAVGKKGGAQTQVSLSKGSPFSTAKGLRVMIDSSGTLDGIEAPELRKLKILDALHRLYSIATPVALVIIIAGMLVTRIVRVFTLGPEIFWITCAIVSAIAARLLLLAVINITSFPVTFFDARYFAALHPLLLMSLLLLMIGWINAMMEKKLSGMTPNTAGIL